MMPGVSKLRQYVLFLVLFAGLMAAGKFGAGPVPDHSFFQEASLSCHPMRQISHHVAIQGKLFWNDPWFEPILAQEEILEMLSDFHRGHNPPLRPKHWPDVKVVSIERTEHEEGPYIVNWQTQYAVGACKKLVSSKEELPMLTALIQKK